MGFQQGELWMYDPHLVISSKILSHGQDHHKAQVELLEN